MTARTVQILAWHLEISEDWPAPGSVAYFVTGDSIKGMDVHWATWKTD